MKTLKPIFLLFSLLSFTISSWAQTSETIFVEPVINSIRVGSFVGNKNLAFGVKNIAEEVLMDHETLILVGEKEGSTYSLQIEITFFDVVTKSKGFSVFHREERKTVIQMKGILYKDGKKIKQSVGEGSSSEISTSTIIIDEGGNINQQSISSSLKKTTINLLTKLNL